MRWFKRTFDTKEEGRGKKDETENRPSSIVPHPSSFNFFFFIFLAFLTGLFLLKADILQSVPVSFSSAGRLPLGGGAQVNWATAIPGVNAALPIAAGYDIYDSKDAGTAAGTDIRLQSISYTAVQTSDAGVQDSCTSTGCVMLAGFSAGTLQGAAEIFTKYFSGMEVLA